MYLLHLSSVCDDSSLPVRIPEATAQDDSSKAQDSTVWKLNVKNTYNIDVSLL